jgi:uncharacterized protein
MAKPIHFEIMAEDPAKAAEFYRNVFGWQISKWDGPMDYWLVTAGAEGEPGINGGLAKSEGPPSTINTMEVTSVDEAVVKVTANGGKVVMPKHAIPGIGYQAYCQDTEGIMFGLHQMDPSAQS